MNSRFGRRAESQTVVFVRFFDASQSCFSLEKSRSQHHSGRYSDDDHETDEQERDRRAEYRAREPAPRERLPNRKNRDQKSYGHAPALPKTQCTPQTTMGKNQKT